MVAPRCAVPAVGLHIVGVFVHSANRQCHPGRALLIEPTNQPALGMPVIERLEKRCLGTLGPPALVVDAHLLIRRCIAFEQRTEPFAQIVAVVCRERQRKIRTPSRHRRHFVLERADDNITEILPRLAFKCLVHRSPERQTSSGIEVVEPALHHIDQPDRMCTEGCRLHRVPLYRQVLERTGRIDLDSSEWGSTGGERDYRGFGTVDPLTGEFLAGIRRLATHDGTLQVCARKADLVIKPQPDPQRTGIGTDTAEYIPPLLREKGWLVCQRAVQRP